MQRQLRSRLNIPSLKMENAEPPRPPGPPTFAATGDHWDHAACDSTSPGTGAHGRPLGPCSMRQHITRHRCSPTLLRTTAEMTDYCTLPVRQRNQGLHIVDAFEELLQKQEITPQPSLATLDNPALLNCQWNIWSASAAASST